VIETSLRVKYMPERRASVGTDRRDECDESAFGDG
jgi:hypothetical protein